MAAEDGWSAERRRKEWDHGNLTASAKRSPRPRTPRPADGSLWSSSSSWDQESWVSHTVLGPGATVPLGRPRRERKTLQVTMRSDTCGDSLGAQRKKMVANPATLEDMKPEWHTEKGGPTVSHGIFTVSLFILWWVFFNALGIYFGIRCEVEI